MKNPWNLNENEVAVAQALVRFGCNKMAARSLSVSVKSIENRLYGMRQKMDGANRVQIAVLWDRFERSESPAGLLTVRPL